MNYIFYYCDYYFIFFITFLLVLMIINSKFYLAFKQEINMNINKSKLLFINFKICLIFVFINLLLFNNFVIKKYELNFIVTYKTIFVFFLILFIFIFSEFSKKFKIFNFEYLVIFIFSSLCLFLLLQCGNFLSFYIMLESYTLSICSVLVLKKLNKKLVEASFKYLVINILSSCFIILGISNVFFSTGLINFNEIAQSLIFFEHFVFKNIYYFGYFLIFIGFSIKLTLFPFSLFLNEIYLGFNNIFIFFFLIIPKFSFTFFFYYLTFFLTNFDNFKILFLFYLLALFTSLLHALISINNLKIKSLIINTSFSNAPFIVFCIFFKSIFSFVVFLNFIFLYFLNLFCFFCLIFIACGSIKYLLKKITSFVSFWYLNKPLTFLLTINLISLSSLPPFSGFFGKLYVFYLLIEYKLFFIYIFLSFINLIIVFCYLRIIKMFFIKNKNFVIKNIYIKKNVLTFLVVFISVLNIFFFFFFDVLYFSMFNIINNYIFF